MFTDLKAETKNSVALAGLKHPINVTLLVKSN